MNDKNSSISSDKDIHDISLPDIDLTARDRNNVDFYDSSIENSSLPGYEPTEGAVNSDVLPEIEPVRRPAQSASAESSTDGADKDNDESGAVSEDIFPDSEAPESDTGYDQYTGMFSENPYDLVTGELKKTDAKKFQKPEVNKRKEWAKMAVPICTMFVLSIPFGFISYFLLCNSFAARMIGTQNNTKIISAAIFFASVFFLAGTFLMVRIYSTVNTKKNKKLDLRFIPLLIPIAFVILSLLTPDNSYVGNVLCAVFLLAAAVSLILAIRKFRKVVMAACALLFCALFMLPLFSGAYKKLLLHPVNIQTEQFIYADRDEEYIPEDSERIHFIRTNEDLRSRSMNEHFIDSYDSFIYLISKKTKDPNYNRFFTTPADQPAVSASDIALDDLMVEAIRQNSAKYDEDFFKNNSLYITYEHFTDRINDSYTGNSSVCGNTVYLEVYTEYADIPYDGSDHFEIGFCIFTLPKEVQPGDFRIERTAYHTITKGK